MIVFVDESGDTGLKFDRGSSRYFVMTAVRFASRADVDVCVSTIADLRTQLRVSPEFKFANTSTAKRIAFFEAIKHLNFSYDAVVFNKAKLYGRFEYRTRFYQSAVYYVFNNLADNLCNAYVIVDKSGDRKFRQAVISYAKKMTRMSDGSPRIKRFRFADSRKENGLQLADMLCGAVARQYGDSKDRSCYRKIISKHEGFVQFWPP